MSKHADTPQIKEVKAKKVRIARKTRKSSRVSDCDENNVGESTLFSRVLLEPGQRSWETVSDNHRDSSTSEVVEVSVMNSLKEVDHEYDGDRYQELSLFVTPPQGPRSSIRNTRGRRLTPFARAPLEESSPEMDDEASKTSNISNQSFSGWEMETLRETPNLPKSAKIKELMHENLLQLGVSPPVAASPLSVVETPNSRLINALDLGDFVSNESPKPADEENDQSCPAQVPIFLVENAADNEAPLFAENMSKSKDNKSLDAGDPKDASSRSKSDSTAENDFPKLDENILIDEENNNLTEPSVQQDLNGAVEASDVNVITAMRDHEHQGETAVVLRTPEKRGKLAPPMRPKKPKRSTMEEIIDVSNSPNRDEPIDEIEETYEELGAVGSHEQMEGKEGEYGNNVDEWVNCSGAPVPLMQSTACDLDYVLTNEEQQQSTALSLEKQKQNKNKMLKSLRKKLFDSIVVSRRTQVRRKRATTSSRRSQRSIASRMSSSSRRSSRRCRVLVSSCSSMSNKKGVSRLGGGGKTQAEVKLVQKSSRHSEEAGRDEGEQNLASGEAGGKDGQGQGIEGWKDREQFKNLQRIKSQKQRALSTSELLNNSPLKFFLDSDKFQSFTIAPCVVAVANVQPQVISSGVLASGPANALDYGSNGVNICPLTLMAKELLSAKASAGELSERLTNECRDRCLSKLNHNKQQRRVDFDESDSL
ncbi:uncharacterized protein LOC134853973 isoform X3 [Symsagittifera roscoffensis]|uniref:uncharacterized protein LOC134853973 isoform X3 n=1 Tax=Symsagittifera roscoffensis TaxID=84072 RepID=UPI00307C14AE